MKTQKQNLIVIYNQNNTPTAIILLNNRIRLIYKIHPASEEELIDLIENKKTEIPTEKPESTEKTEYQKCEGCNEDILEGEAIIKGENRHSICS
jgi:hypothetical protein